MTEVSKAVLNAYADTNLADNTTRDILPLHVRTAVKDLVDSSVFLDDIPGAEGQILVYGPGGVLEAGDNVGYDEGVWTPGVEFNLAAVGMTFSEQTGRYVRVGNLVHAVFRFTMTNKGSSVGNAALTGLPFNIALSYGALVAGFYSGMNLASPGISGFPSSGSTITLRNLGLVTAATLTETAFTNSSVIIGSVSYRTS